MPRRRRIQSFDDHVACNNLKYRCYKHICCRSSRSSSRPPSSLGCIVRFTSITLIFRCLLACSFRSNSSSCSLCSLVKSVSPVYLHWRRLTLHLQLTKRLMQTFVIILKITKDGSYISLRIRGWVHSGICFCFNCLVCLLVPVWWCIITVNVVLHGIALSLHCIALYDH